MSERDLTLAYTPGIELSELDHARRLSFALDNLKFEPGSDSKQLLVDRLIEAPDHVVERFLSLEGPIVAKDPRAEILGILGKNAPEEVLRKIVPIEQVPVR